jgi:hypothetical protein
MNTTLAAGFRTLGRLVRWLSCVMIAATMFLAAFRAVMIEPLAWTGWRPWVGWLMVWIACDIYQARRPRTPNQVLDK